MQPGVAGRENSMSASRSLGFSGGPYCLPWSLIETKQVQPVSLCMCVVFFFAGGVLLSLGFSFRHFAGSCEA